MTECPHCARKFKEDEEYARHILSKHPQDEMRADWAHRVLGDLDEENLEGGTMDTEEPTKESKHKKTTEQEEPIAPVKPRYVRPVATAKSESTLKKVFGNLATIIAIAALLLALWSLLAARTAGTSVQGFQDDLEALQGTVTTYGNYIATLQTKSDTLQTNYATLQTNYATLQANYASLSTSYGTLDTNYGMLVSSVSALTSQLTAANVQLNVLASVPNAQLAYLSDSAANVTVLTEGNYSVFVALCGLNITNVAVSSNHTLASSWAMNVTGTNIDTKYVVRVNPVSVWTAGDVIALTVASNETEFAEVWTTKR